MTDDPKDLRYFAEVLNTLSDGGVTSPLPEIAQSTDHLAKFAAQELQAMGADVHLGELYPYPPNSDKMHQSMVAIFYPPGYDKTKPVTENLTFSGHVDVVPTEKEWDGHDPLKLRKEGDKYVVRGAVDMRGHIAALIASIKNRETVLSDLKEPLVLMLSSCEEVGVLGVKDACELAFKQNITPDKVVVMEATQDILGTGNKGIRADTHIFTTTGEPPPHLRPDHDTQFTIRLDSTGGHSSVLGTPIEPGDVIQKLNQHIQHIRKDLYVPNLEITNVALGEAFNVTASHATVTIGMSGTDQQKRIVAGKLREAVEIITKEGEAKLKKLNFVLGNIFDTTFENIKLQVSPPEPAITPNTIGNNALETALDRISEVYDAKEILRKVSSPGFPTPAFAKIAGGVPMINGNAQKTTVYTAFRSTEKVANNQIYDRVSKALMHQLPSDISLVSEKAADVPPLPNQYNSEFAKNTEALIQAIGFREPRTTAWEDLVHGPGVEKAASRVIAGLAGRMSGTIGGMPYGSDGSFIKELCPNANVIILGKGGLKNLPHAEGEFITEGEVRKDISLYGSMIDFFSFKRPLIDLDDYKMRNRVVASQGTGNGHGM